jgi:hypothetical protein
MNPLAPVTRQTSSRAGSIGLPRQAPWSLSRARGTPRWRSVALAMSRTTLRVPAGGSVTLGQHGIERGEEARRLAL